MKRTISFSLALLMLGVFSLLTLDSANAQQVGNQYGKKNMEQYGPRDDDGDGIPNGQDPDYVKPKDGTGNGRKTGVGTGACDGTGPKGRG